MHFSGNPAAQLLLTVAIVLGAIRIYELLLSVRHERKLLASGGHRVPADGLWWIILGQALFFVGLVVEGLQVPPEASITPFTWIFLPLATVALALRHWCVQTLGERWTIHVIILPGEPLITAGPYRFLRHPNYLAVSVELASVCLAFQLWWTLLATMAVSAPALLNRARVEESVLRPLRNDSTAQR